MSIKKISTVSNRLQKLFEGSIYSLMLITAAVWVLFYFATGGVFLSARNVATLILQSSILGCSAVGMMVVILTGGIDLSIGSVVLLLSGIGAVLNIGYNVNPIWVMLVMMVCAIAIAAIQGFIVSHWALPAFIVTMAGQLAFKGVGLILTGGHEYAPVEPLLKDISTTWLPPSISIAIISATFLAFTISQIISNKKECADNKPVGKLLLSFVPLVLLLAALIYASSYNGLPILGIVLAIFALIIHIMLTYTRFGRQLYAVGANPQAAKLSGVNPKLIVFKAFLVMGAGYFLASVGTMSRISGFVPSIGTGMELDAIAAAVIGGTSLVGGYGSVAGAIVGAFLLTSIDNGMYLMNVPTFYQYVAKGIILVIAVLLDVSIRKRRV